MVQCPTIQIKATPKFLKLARKHLAGEALQGLIDTLVLHPKTGVVIRDADGIRKFRWKTGKSNKGKSGGIRVLYYYEKNTVILLAMYKKANKENISNKERKQLKSILSDLLKEM